MSTKTSIKRIALVAVSAMGFGLLSIIPAQAAGTGVVSVTTMTAPTAGSQASVPVDFTFGGTEVPDETFILTASLQSYPNGETVTSAPTWDITDTTFAAANAAAQADIALTSASVVTITQANTTAENNTTNTIGVLKFTPSLPGTYVIKITGTGTGTNANAFIFVNVTGMTTTQALSGVSTSTPTGATGGNVTLVYSLPKGAVSGSIYTVTTSGQGSIVSVNSQRTATPSFTLTTVDSNMASGTTVFTGTTGVTKTNGTDWSAGATYTAGSTVSSAVYDLDGANAAAPAEQISVTLNSAVAGSTVVTIKSISPTTGVASTKATANVTWGAAASIYISEANSDFAIVKSAATCDSDASIGTQRAALATNARTSLSYGDVTSAGRQAFLCLIVRDGTGALVPSANIDSITYTIDKGSLSNAAIVRGGTALDMAAGNDAYSFQDELFGDGLSTGEATVTITVVEGVAAFSKTAKITYFSEIASLSLVQRTYAAAAANSTTWAGSGDYPTSAAGAIATRIANTIAFALLCKDAEGLVVPNCDVDGDGADSNDDTFYATVDSDIISGSPTFSATSPANSKEGFGGTVNVIQDSADLSAVYLDGAYVTVNCGAATQAATKLVVNVYIDDAATSGTNFTISGSGTYYCSGSTSSITVTPSASTLNAGESATVTVMVKDAKEYPVADATSVTLAATNGSVINPSAKTTVNGTFTTAPTFIAGSQGSTSIVTASAGTKVGSATVTINGGTQSSVDAAADAAAEAIDAANAATDAANLAAEAADAATVAAEEARDAADAATAAVEALATEVATMMAALKAQLATLAKTIAKIAKKVKA